METSLIDLMKNDFCFESLKEAKEQTKQSKKVLSANAESYNQQFKDEIDEGTRKRQLMLEAKGIKDGTPEAEKALAGTFYPTVQTPILNFLYFLERDFEDVTVKVENLKEEYEKKYGGLCHEDVDTSALQNNKARDIFGVLQSQGEHQEDTYQTGNHVPHMEKYIYQNMDAGTFGKLKKLKALSMSDNEEEAHFAWQKCMEICNKYGLKFDDIPCKY